MRSTISDPAIRPVAIVLFDSTSDRCPRFLHIAILPRPDFLLRQAAMEPFDVAVAQFSRGGSGRTWAASEQSIVTVSVQQLLRVKDCFMDSLVHGIGSWALSLFSIDLPSLRP